VWRREFHLTLRASGSGKDKVGLNGKEASVTWMDQLVTRFGSFAKVRKVTVQKSYKRPVIVGIFDLFAVFRINSLSIINTP
jgi:hypothetical protein